MPNFSTRTINEQHPRVVNNLQLQRELKSKQISIASQSEFVIHVYLLLAKVYSPTSTNIKFFDMEKFKKIFMS